MLQDHDLRRVSWRCVHFATADAVTEALRLALDRAAIAQFDLNAEPVRTKPDLLRALARAMDFPAYFGMNWDAADECLRDLHSWRPAKGYVLFVQGGDWLWRHGPGETGMLVETWLGAAEAWSQAGVPFHLVFVSIAPPTALA